MTYRIHTFDTPGFVKMEGVGRIHYYIMYGAGIVWVTFSSMYTMPYPHYYVLEAAAKLMLVICKVYRLLLGLLYTTKWPAHLEAMREIESCAFGPKMDDF